MAAHAQLPVKTGIDLNQEMFRIHSSLCVTIRRIATAMRQGWEDGCEGVGQLRQDLFALKNACHLSTIACVCKEAVTRALLLVCARKLW